MSNDLIKQLSWFVVNEVRMPGGLLVTAIEKIEKQQVEIKRLTHKLDALDYYLEHSSTCASRCGKLRDCTCGLEEARRG